VSARTRTYATVAVAALAAAGLVVAAVAFTRTSTGGGGSAHAQTTPSVRGRAPALVLDLGVRTDPEARALRRANRLYANGDRRAAGREEQNGEELPDREVMLLITPPAGAEGIATIAPDEPPASG